MFRVRYLREKKNGAEIAFCENSALSYPLHNHISSFTFGRILSGSIELTVAGAAFVCRAGQAFLLAPYVPHAIRAIEPYSLWSVCLDQRHFAAWETQGFFAAGATTRQILRFAEPRRGCDLFEPRIARLVERIETYPEAEFRIDDMARAAFLSKYHFIRRFKEQVGLSPHQFQMQNRVRKARHLFERAATLTEAALAAGFCDQSHLIRQFEKFVGITPTAYRASRGEIVFARRSEQRGHEFGE